MNNVFEELAERTTKLNQLFEELSAKYFTADDISSVACHGLTESLGVQLRGAPLDSVVVNTLAGEVKAHQGDNGLLSVQIKLLRDPVPLELALGSAATLRVKPAKPHKRSLPELIKADCWNYTVLEKACLPAVLEIAQRHKIVQRGDATFYFDESLEWLVEDGVDSVKVFGKSKKFGLLKEVRDRLKNEVPAVLVDRVKQCLRKEIEVLQSAEPRSFTTARRALVALEVETDLAVQEIMR